MVGYLYEQLHQFQTKKRIIMMSKSTIRNRDKGRFFSSYPNDRNPYSLVFSCEITPEPEL